MQQYELQFIENQADAHNVAEEIFEKISTSGVKDQKSQKDLIDKLFNKIFDNLNNHASSPASKFMSALILKDIIESSLRPQSKLSKVFTVLLNHRLFKHLQYMCDTIDPYKQVKLKGKTQFAADPVSGNNLMRLVLQIVKFLPSKFPKSKNEEPTAFKKAYNKLVEKKVQFPYEYKYITHATKTNQQNGTSNRQRKPERQMVQPPMPSGKPQTPRQSQFNFLCNRLKTFIQTLQQEDQEQFLLKEINKMHGIIKVQLPKAINVANEVAESTDPEFINRFFDVSELMQKEMTIYEKYIDRSRDLKSYTEELKKVGRKVFPGSAMSPKTTPVGTVQDKAKTSIKKTDSHYGMPIMEPKEQLQRVSKIQKSEIKQQVDSKVLNQLGKYFERVEQRSKSPISAGFKKIGQSLSRQKSKNNTIRSKVSPLNKSNFNKSINSLKQSKIAAIFTNPPNPNPPPRHYEGLEIQQNEAINHLLTKIDKNQGHRRFKTANFKGKSSLFENQHLQIGYKSQAIYEEISGFRVLLKIQLFFGNLTDSNIRNLTIDYKGDQNILLYANPKIIDNSIIKGEQNKVQLIVIPLKPEFPLLIAQVRYDLGDITQRFQLILPNSALKFARFMELSRDDFLSRWSSAQLYKTTEFQLSHYLPPDTLIRWIPSLSELVSYTTFVSPGSKKDYELFTEVIMMQKYDALMKINVRPNLNVVIQLGVEQKIDEINSYFATFLQHLQQFMKQNK